ncbi:MAG: hypothetical protein WC455_29415 [Dehalococcoidia bacterium]|jgi:hypothetical protein
MIDLDIVMAEGMTLVGKPEGYDLVIPRAIQQNPATGQFEMKRIVGDPEKMHIHQPVASYRNTNAELEAAYVKSTTGLVLANLKA